MTDIRTIHDMGFTTEHCRAELAQVVIDREPYIKSYYFENLKLGDVIRIAHVQGEFCFEGIEYKPDNCTITRYDTSFDLQAVYTIVYDDENRRDRIIRDDRTEYFYAAVHGMPHEIQDALPRIPQEHFIGWAKKNQVFHAYVLLRYYVPGWWDGYLQ